MHSLLNIFAPALSELRQALEEAIKYGEINRAKDLKEDFIKQYPRFSRLIEKLFAGTPEDVLIEVDALYPGASHFPGALLMVGQFQNWLRIEMSKPRFTTRKEVAPENRRLK